LLTVFRQDFAHETACYCFGLGDKPGASLFAGETLRLKVEPDHEYLLAGSPQEVIVKIDLLAGAHKKKAKRTPLNLAVVLDRSGSMAGAKIEKARQAAMELVDRLSPDDIISFVIYSDRAELVFPAQRVEDKEALKERISRVRTQGSTALYAGVELGLNRLSGILLVGELTGSSCCPMVSPILAQARLQN
jgi:Ca-activated chloride channel family protein